MLPIALFFLILKVQKADCAFINLSENQTFAVIPGSFSGSVLLLVLLTVIFESPIIISMS